VGFRDHALRLKLTACHPNTYGEFDMDLIDPKTGERVVKKRRRRYDGFGDARELTFSCFHRYQFLARDRTRQWFIDELIACRKKWGFHLWAYVIMPEHVHLLVHPQPPNLDVGRIAGDLKENVARKAIRFLEVNAPSWLPRITVREGNKTRRRFWQPGGGYDRNAIEVASLYSMIEYIHANPVRRELVARADDWEWSSARWYAGIRSVPIEMDPTLPHMTIPANTPFA
jgi:putative transposase